MAAACVSVLKLPLSRTIITLFLTSRAGVGVSPLIVVAGVVGCRAIGSLSALRDAVSTQRPIPVRVRLTHLNRRDANDPEQTPGAPHRRWWKRGRPPTDSTDAFGINLWEARPKSNLLIGGYVVPAILIVILVIIWVILAFWPARVAGRKGHSFFGYFVLSIIFFPLAVILAYAVDDRTRAAI